MLNKVFFTFEMIVRKYIIQYKKGSSTKKKQKIQNFNVHNFCRTKTFQYRKKSIKN